MKLSGEEETDLFLLGGPGAEAHDQVCRCREHLLIR